MRSSPRGSLRRHNGTVRTLGVGGGRYLPHRQLQPVRAGPVRRRQLAHGSTALRSDVFSTDRPSLRRKRSDSTFRAEEQGLMPGRNAMCSTRHSMILRLGSARVCPRSPCRISRSIRRRTLRRYELDRNGNVLGGVRTPAVDTPIAVLSGIPPANSPGFCATFGQTNPLTAIQIEALYPTHADFVHDWLQAVHKDTEAGALLPRMPTSWPRSLAVESPHVVLQPMHLGEINETSSSARGDRSRYRSVPKIPGASLGRASDGKRIGTRIQGCGQPVGLGGGTRDWCEP